MAIFQAASMASQAQEWSKLLQPLLLMWKVRLPLIALPVIASLRQLAGAPLPQPSPNSFRQECLLLLAISIGTGFFRLPFSVTWWLVLIAAFVMETKLLIGVSTVLAASVLLGWYGSLIRHPHAICALWSCRLGKAADNAAESTSGMSIPLGFWQFWDLAVHGMPAVLMLIWHGPGYRWQTGFSSGTVSTVAAAVALPLNLFWLWGLTMGLGRRPWLACLADTNAVYKIAPMLPSQSWRWIYGSHWATCCFWLVLLICPVGFMRNAASFTVLFATWRLFAKSQLREDLMFGSATFFLIVHFLAVWGMVRACTHQSAVQLWLEVVVMWQVGGFGITCGAHRLWSHRSYEAKLPFRLVLMLLNSFANQGTIFHWARDHRAHHKWTDTDADPHDTRRGFFFAHIGWLLLPKTAELKNKGATIPYGDLLADPVVAFQKWAEDRFMFMEVMSFGLPAVYGYVAYKDVLLGFLVHGMLRWLITLHATWCVNSVAHYFGEAKYDKDASARESMLTTMLAVGEGWHSYHHKFPWDYATSEFGPDRQWNPSKLFIDAAAALGQVTHKKRADHLARKQRAD